MQASSEWAALEAAVDQAFARGDRQAGLAALRELADRAPAQAEILHRLAVVEEQIGESQRALAAHLKCLEVAPDNPLAWLYAGFCLEQLGRREQALAVYSLGADVDPRILASSRGSDPTALRLRAAAKLLREHMTELHRAAVGAAQNLAVVREAIWTRTHAGQFSFDHAGQRPQLFYLPGLPAQAWYNSDDWEWAAELERAADHIVEEFAASLALREDWARPYLGDGMRLGEEFADLQGSLNWTALDLYRDGERNEAVARHFPRTLAALGRAPLYGLDDRPFEVFFSVLKPRQHIKPHYGLSNHSLTVHLPLAVPENCALVVDGEVRHWQAGRLSVFDDTFLHEAWNRSERERVVLIFSVWQPDLSPEQRAAVQRSFLARSQWLESRTVPAS